MLSSGFKMVFDLFKYIEVVMKLINQDFTDNVITVIADDFQSDESKLRPLLSSFFEKNSANDFAQKFTDLETKLDEMKNQSSLIKSPMLDSIIKMQNKLVQKLAIANIDPIAIEKAVDERVGKMSSTELPLAIRKEWDDLKRK